MKYLASLSGGAGSTLAYFRAIEKHGIENCHPVFADTKEEHDSLYDLLEGIESLTGKPIVRAIDGRTIWQVFNDAKGIKFRGGCKASTELKTKQLVKHTLGLGNPDEVTVVLGLDWQEPERIYGTEKRIGAVRRWHPYPVWCPMEEAPKLSQCQMIDAIKTLGLPTQALYDRGYPHNNCGGGCVLAGTGQWAGLLKDDPERFARHEAEEQAFNRRHREGKAPFTILKDRRGGKKEPMFLYQLRERVEAGEKFRDFRSTCGCMLSEPMFDFCEV